MVILKLLKKYNELNREKKREQNKKWREENKEYSKKRREENKEKKIEYDKKYNELNREKRREQNKKWREENKEHRREYRQEKKAICLEYLGGKCVVCGTTHNLEFDHIKREGKKYEISSRVSNNFDNIKEELDKCQLLCAPCHLDKTAKEWVDMYN